MARRLDDLFRSDYRRINILRDNNCAVSKRFVFNELFWELHCPRNVRGPPVEFAVDEVRAAPEEQTDRRSNHKCVPQICPGKFVSARVIKSERKNANHSAVTGHAAFPYPQD